jgi:soluble lytic murein transglycosylase-like protein
MTGEIERVEARIQQIEGLLGGTDTPNVDFRSVLTGTSPSAIGPYIPSDVRPIGASGSGGASCPPALQPAIANAAAQTGLPSDLISAVIQQESSFQNGEVSPSGAAGLMQIMPQTAQDLGVTDVFDPMQNILGGATYLRRQLDKFGSVQKALAAYNAGPGAVEQYRGVPPYPETQRYVQKVMGALEQKQR